MSYPLAPEKHGNRSATDPGILYDEDESFPEAVVLCFQPPLYEYAREEYDGRVVDPGHPRYSLYVLADGDETVGAVGDLGIGGPATARVVDELVARGVETVVIVGHAGGLQRDVPVGDVIVADRALRDEGTSYHYLEPDREVEASPSLTGSLADAARANGETVHLGTTWTTDAIFRATVPEVERHADAGVLTVDMEAATLFAVAAHRGIDAGAAFVISDYVGTDDWEGHLSDTWSHLRRLFDSTVAAVGAVA